MVLFDVTSLYMNIPIIDTWNIIKDYVNNDDQLTRKAATTKDLSEDLSNLTCLYNLVLSFTNKQHFQPQVKSICKLMNILQYQ